MSSGHNHQTTFGLDSGALDRLLSNPLVRDRLWQVGRRVDRTFDCAYVAGYSQDGDTIYIDRHMPETIKLQLDGQVKEIDPDDFLLRHERLEKTLIDTLGFDYDRAHRAATAYEKRGLMMALGPGWWPVYDKVMDKYIKSDAHEKLIKVPADLDMTPYYASPVDKKLIAHMERVMGHAKNKRDKEDVDYSDGMAKSHCGPVKYWPKKGECGHYLGGNKCKMVRGYIEPRAWCKLWESLAEEAREHGESAET